MIRFFLALIAGLFAVTILASMDYSIAQEPSYEVWAVDQANTVGSGGGLVYIWNSNDLVRNARDATPEVIDLASAATTANCNIATRPHMIWENYSNPPSHMLLANLASGDTFFMDIPTRQVVGCVSTKDAAGGALNSHNSSATPDNTKVLVDTIGSPGQSGFLHEITTNYDTNTYSLGRTLNLGAATLPTGVSVKNAVGTALIRPICHEFTEDSQFAYVTLAGGGLLVVDVNEMAVKHAYPATTVPGIGCGVLRLPGDRMLTTGESGENGGDDFLYAFATGGVANGIFPDPVKIELPGEDTHGISLCTARNGHLFLATFMRVSNDLVFVDLETYQVTKKISMSRGFSRNPTPDISDTIGNTMFVALRGAKPLSAITREDANRTPGLAKIQMNNNCNAISWGAKDIAPMVQNPNSVVINSRTVNAADPHGMAVVQRSPSSAIRPRNSDSRNTSQGPTDIYTREGNVIILPNSSN